MEQPPIWTRSQAKKLLIKIDTSSDPSVVRGPLNAPCVKKKVTRRPQRKSIKKRKPRRDEESENSLNSPVPGPSTATSRLKKEVTRRRKRKCVCVTHIRGFCVSVYTGHKLHDEAYRCCEYFLKGQA